MRAGPLGSSNTGIVPIQARSHARTERVRATEDPADRFHTAHQPQHGGYGRFEARWTEPDIDDPRFTQRMTQPRGPFLAQVIVQEELGPGLVLDDAADTARAYRRAGRPLVAVRAGIVVDVAA